MRAAILREYGATPELGEFDEPVASEGQEVVEVLAAGLNPVDIAKASGHFYGGSPPLPSVAGSEGVGRLADGRQVYFGSCLPPFGALAERTLVEAGGLFAVPDGLDPALAVCFGVAGSAGWLAVEWRAEVAEGETVLVLGASGTVGLVAVQAARLLGAGRVVAAARSAEGLERAAAVGADATVRLGEPEDLAAAFREACGGAGPDVVIDPLWGPPALAAIDAAKPYCRHVQLGQSAAPVVELPSAAVRGRPVSILGYTNFAVPPDVRRAAYERMVAHAAAGDLTADYERVPLDRAPEAWERMKAGPGTKLVVVP
jgi:NADPH:quinone reductase-like Zn-dependent oxidoreductase